MIAFGDRAQRRVARIAIVRPRLRIEAEGRARPEPESGEGGVGAGMAFVAAEHGEAARERAFARNRIHVLRVAGRRNDLAIVAAVDLMQKAPVPRLRQPEFEAERIMASRRPLRARWLRRKRRRPQARHWPRARRRPRRSARSAGRPIPSSPPRRRGAWRLRRLLRALRRRRERWPRRATPARRGRSLA